MPFERAQFMFALATGVEIDFSHHGIDVIYKAHTKKELNLPFGNLIIALAMKAKISHGQNEYNLKMVGPISTITVVKSKTIVTKRKSHTTKSASSLEGPLVTSSQTLEQLSLLSQKVNSMNNLLIKHDQKVNVVQSDCMQANDKVVQLSLDVPSARQCG